MIRAARPAWVEVATWLVVFAAALIQMYDMRWRTVVRPCGNPGHLPFGCWCHTGRTRRHPCRLRGRARKPTMKRSLARRSVSNQFHLATNRRRLWQ